MPQPHLSPDAVPAWWAILIVGAVLLVAGLLDQAALWLPFNLGTPAWEFATATTSLDTFPLLGVGLVLGLGAALSLGLRWTTQGLALACVALILVLCLVAALYIRVLPSMWHLAADPQVRVHVQRAAVKTGLAALLYPILLLVLVTRTWRATRSPMPGRAPSAPMSSPADKKPR